MSDLTASQQRSIAIGCLDIHQRLADMEAMLSETDEPAGFSRYVCDLTPVEQQILQDYFTRIRETMRDLLARYEVPLGNDRTNVRWGIETGLMFVKIAIAEMSPAKLRGFGRLSAEGRVTAERMTQELNRLVDQASEFLHRGAASHVTDRLAKFNGRASDLTSALTTFFRYRCSTS